MGETKVTEPGVGPVDLLDDRIDGNRILRYREVEYEAWADIDYKGVSSPGTAERLTGSAAPNSVRGVVVIANPYNNNPIAVGPHASTSAVATTAGFRGWPVYPGQAVALPLGDPYLAFVDNLADDLWAYFTFTHVDT